MVGAQISGRETLASIEKAVRDVSDEVSRLSAELDTTNQEKARLVAQRLQAFGELAELRTRLALVDGVIDQADRLSAQVTTMLQARQRSFDLMRKREADATARRDELVAALREIGARIEAKEDQLDRMAEQARDELAAQPEYAAQKARLDDLNAVVAKAAEKAEQAAEEEAQKGAPYRNDPLFMYLWTRGFATSRYTATGIVRALDNWVAGLVGFHGARANFAMLTEIPKRLAAHVERLKSERDAEQAALDRLEAAHIRQLAGTDLPEALALARAERETHAAEIERLNAEIVETGHQIRQYAEGLDQPFRDAIARTRDFLDGQTLEDLIDDARQTPDIGDDRIVSVIERAAAGISEAEKAARRKREQLDTAFARKEELLRIAAEFRRKRYDDPGSVFEPRAGSNTQILLEQLLKGLITAAEYWARTQRNQKWRDRPGDSYRRSTSFPRAPWPSSGDFRTGGGF